MGKGYIWSRLLRSVLSILIIMLIVFTMIYTMVPRENIFFEDSTYRKLSSKSDDKTEYVYSTWQKLGYLDYVRINDYCLTLYEAGTPEMSEAVKPESKESQDFVRIYTEKGYTVEKFLGNGRYYAYKDVPMIRRMASWLSKLIVIDTPLSVKDETNPDLPRSLSLGRTPTGGVALIGSGSVHKYLLYTDSHFPWLHQNIIKLNFGTSYPSYQGLDVMRVLFQSQGTEVKRHVTFDTGYETDSGINFGTLKYKSVLDRMDKKKFNDNYADYEVFRNQPSMIGTSFIMGLLAMGLAYLLGLPIGVLMARRKDAASRFDEYPFQYSGGMRQRIVIAIALSCHPEILICDEPTTALDVTIQAQIISLIRDLQHELGFTTLYITHDLGVVANVADRVGVMYGGQIIEYGNVEEIFFDPRHPYTWALLSSLPQLGEKGKELYYITGTPPSLYNEIKGDAFAPRNEHALKINFVQEPPFFKVTDTHYAKTWLLDPRAPKLEKPEVIRNLHEKIQKMTDKGGAFHVE